MPTPRAERPTTPAPSHPRPDGAAGTGTVPSGGAGTGAGHRRVRRVAAVAVLVLVTLLASGCVRVRAGLALGPDDTISGTVDVATPGGAPGGSGPPIQVPSELSGDVTVTRYEQDGYIGSHLEFSGLTFDQVSRLLPAVSPSAGSAVQLQFRRAGDRVVLSGRVDLTRVTPESADVQLKIAFPGPVTQTDGTASQGVVSWTFSPGAVGEVNAVAQYPDPNAPSWATWAGLLGLLVLVAAVTVFVLAASERTRGPSRARAPARSRR